MHTHKGDGSDLTSRLVQGCNTVQYILHGEGGHAGHVLAAMAGGAHGERLA
jgi:hypothetical protein